MNVVSSTLSSPLFTSDRFCFLFQVLLAAAHWAHGLMWLDGDSALFKVSFQVLLMVSLLSAVLQN